MLYNTREGLFGEEITEYDQVGSINRKFEPYNMLWKTASDWLNTHKEWMSGAFTNMDAETVEKPRPIE